LTKLPDVPHYKQHPVAECKEIVQEFTYNIGVAMAYLWRAKYKHETPIEDYQKAIDHIGFEIDKLQKEFARNELKAKGTSL